MGVSGLGFSDPHGSDRIYMGIARASLDAPLPRGWEYRRIETPFEIQRNKEAQGDDEKEGEKEGVRGDDIPPDDDFGWHRDEIGWFKESEGFGYYLNPYSKQRSMQHPRSHEFRKVYLELRSQDEAAWRANTALTEEYHQQWPKNHGLCMHWGTLNERSRRSLMNMMWAWEKVVKSITYPP